MDTNHCMASAISAGLGAMTFRNHLRSLTEISDKTKGRLKTAGKIGAGALAVGVAGKLAYDKIKDNENSRNFSYTDKLMARQKYAGVKSPHTYIPGRGPLRFKGDESPAGYLASTKREAIAPSYNPNKGPIRPTD